MVMSMDAYADQTMSSPPLPTNEDSAASPSAIMSSPSPFQQQESADDEHDDEHSKGSSQTVVAKHQEQHSAQLRNSNDNNKTPLVDERVGSPETDEHHQEKMIVSRGSSFDGDKKLEMNVDDESNEESSMRTNSKFDPTELNAKLTQQAKTTGMPSNSKVESSLVAQMRDIVEGGPSRAVSDQMRHINEQGRQPKSSNDSLNNQNDNNTSKTSLDSVTGHKRTRHSRAHQCRHHHNHHHHQHRHRQSISAASITGSQVDSGLTAPGSNTGTNPSHSHYVQHHHHHRHSNTSHTHPHHHHHHHSGHHHHHHHHHKGGTSSKRNSIQRLALTESVPNQQQQQQQQQQQGKNESNSSVSSNSLTKQGQQSNSLNQSQPESGKSSGSPSDEQIIDTELQESNQQASRDGHHHHHNHHHHCHHRSHKKRLVLDAGNNQPEAVAKSSEDSSSRRKPLQDSTSGMNVEPTKYHQHAHHQPHEHGHHHHHHHHAHHHHHHPHHHHHHAHSIHCADYQGSSNKDLTDPSQQQSVPDGAQQHHHHQRHHKHHHSHNHSHHCRHNRHRARGRSGSKANNSLRDSEKNLDTVDADQVTAGRRFSSHSVAADAKRNDEQSTKNDMNLAQDQESKDDDVVNMDVSPKSDRRASQVVLNNQDTAPIMSDVNSRPKMDANLDGDALNDTEIGAGGGAGDTSRKHDSSCNIDQTIQANQENINSRGVGANEDGHNRLSRQISSQSSKKSQKDSLHGAGQNQQDQRHNECAEPSLQVAGANQQASRPRQIIESSVTADRRCRLCWCCCCPCSALNVREAPDRSVDKNKSTSGPPSSPTSKYPSPPNVSLDEIRSWGESFDKLMKCIDGRKVFQDFLRCEYSEENILFWSACEELKKEKDSKSVAAKARDIYEDYISILSSKEVSLDSRVRDVINNNIKKPTSNIFDEAQLQIYTLMHRDSYPRFINSGMYKKLAQIATSNSRKSSS